MQTVEQQLNEMEDYVSSLRGTHFDSGEPISIGRAPGRLDVLGGVADYSGSVVLEYPIAAATFAAVQPALHTQIRMATTFGTVRTRPEVVELPLDSLFNDGVLVAFEQAALTLASGPMPRWSGYVAGCVYVLLASGWLPVEKLRGLNIAVHSSVPIAAGLASSAALEVSVMSAVCGALGIQVDGSEMSRLCQIVENRVVGAACGIMDQVTVCLGQADRLLALKCQPSEVMGHIQVPAGWRFVGLTSGVRHSVGSSAYTRARIGAFMALRIVQDDAGSDLDGYLCNVRRQVWGACRVRLPELMSGEEFRRRFDDYPDSVTSPAAHEMYAVRSCAEHAIEENERVRDLLALMSMAGDEPDEQMMMEAGRLMGQSHVSYSNKIGLGCAETDLLVDLLMEHGAQRGVFGAKITGGGNGGTVAVLCRADFSHSVLRDVVETYESRTGLAAQIIEGSSLGAIEFGVRTI